MVSERLTWQAFNNPGDRAGLALVATAGLASALSTLALLSYIVWNSFLTREKTAPLPRGVRSFTRSSLGCYLMSLLFCDFLQGIAFTLNYRYSVLGLMAEGRVCTIQGVVSEIGDLGAAIWSIAIAYHTFWLLFLVQKPHRFMVPAILACGWTMIIVLPILGPTVIQKQHRGSFYGLSGAWCWIGPGYGPERLVYLYAWVFIALGSSFIIYTLIYLRFSNVIAAGENGKLTIHFRRPQPPPNTPRPVSISHTGTGSGVRVSRRISGSLPGCFDWARDTRDGTAMSTGTGSGSDHASNGVRAPIGKHLKRVARRLMWYPILYTVVVLPVSVCRMGVLAGWQPPFGLLVFAGICFASSGVSNVILFITTRHSFIKQVARGHGTRVHITTQRITVRENTTLGGVELEEMKLTDPLTPNTGNSPYFPGIENATDTKRYSTAGSVMAKSRVEILGHDGFDGDVDVERAAGIRITVLGRQ